MIFEELKPGKTHLDQKIEAFKTHIKAKKYNYLLSGIYGDKVEGICILQNLYKWLSSEHSMEDLPLIILPILNVDGYSSLDKHNAAKKILCEDFKNLQEDKKFPIQPETDYLLNLFKKYPPKNFIHFNSGKPPHIFFTEGGKKIASFVSKFNFYDLKSLQEKESLHALSSFLMNKYKCPLIDIRYPKVVKDLGLNEIWEHNKKSLFELFNSELLG